MKEQQKQHLEKKVERLKRKLRQAYSYRLALLKDIEQSNLQLAKQLTEEEKSSWQRRIENCRSRVTTSEEKAERIQKHLDLLNTKLSEL